MAPPSMGEVRNSSRVAALSPIYRREDRTYRWQVAGYCTCSCCPGLGLKVSMVSK